MPWPESTLHAHTSRASCEQYARLKDFCQERKSKAAAPSASTTERCMRSHWHGNVFFILVAGRAGSHHSRMLTRSTQTICKGRGQLPFQFSYLTMTQHDTVFYGMPHRVGSLPSAETLVDQCDFSNPSISNTSRISRPCVHFTPSYPFISHPCPTPPLLLRHASTISPFGERYSHDDACPSRLHFLISQPPLHHLLFQWDAICR